jgi:CHASE2 domain-containing sensor protein/predicted Ser/Thr protein kinase
VPSLERRPWRTVALLVIGLIAGALAVALREAGAFEWLEHSSLEARFAIRGTHPPPANVVVIAVDIESKRRAGRYPIPRAQEAAVVDALRRAGATVVAFDLALEGRTSRGADLRLARSLERTGAAVVAVTAIRAGGRTQPLVGRVPFDGVRVRPGHLFLPTDSDTVVRRFPAAYRGVPGLAIVAANLEDARTKIADAPAGALIDFAGPADTVASVPFWKVRNGSFEASLVRGRVAVVGPTETVAGDVRATAVAGEAMPGPEIQANAIATALAGYPLRRMSAGATTVLLLLLGGAVCVLSILPRGPMRRSGVGGATVAVAGALALVAWTVGAQLAFGAGTVVDYSTGAFALLASFGGGGALFWTAGRRERQEQRRLFADYSPELVRRVLDHSAADPAALSNTEIVAGYRVEQLIGKGGMGVVYRATQLSFPREVALKLIRPSQALHPSFRARFKREATAAALVGHPNIVPVYDAGEDDGILYISMQLVSGTDLAKLLRRLGPLDGKLLVAVVRQIAAALDAAHAHGLVHRDVKPGNILLTTNLEHAYLTDFGVAKQLGEDHGLTRPGGWVGTIDYLAPELVDAQPASARSDIYALTAVLYHGAAGAVPFDLPSAAAKLRAHATVIPPSVPLGPAALDDVIARGMAKDPAQRFATASELAAAAARAFGLGEPEPPSPRADPDPPLPDQGPTEVAE